jgi:hypothetical protein
MKHWVSLAWFIAPLALGACGELSNNELSILFGTQQEQALLQELRTSLPQRQLLLATSPDSDGRAVGDAYLPTMGKELADGVNGSVLGIVGLLDTLLNIEPTFLNKEKQEFVWGPWPNDDAGEFGMTAAILTKNPNKENGDPPDFDVSYALMRGVSDDLTTMVPVVWGGATPDEENPEQGSGVTIWDFETNHQFILDNMDVALADDDFDPSQNIPRGRFVAVYGQDQGDDGTFRFVYAVLRKFVDDKS